MEGVERESRAGELLKGKYELAERLGVGGMGEVYRARNLLVDRWVAIKLLHRELAGDPHVIERFMREAKASNVVRHRNIVDVLDIDTAEDGAMFIVEEYLEGEDLSARLAAEQGRLEPKAALDLLIPVCEAVGAAHAKGLVHRDLKPENIFLALFDSEIVPKVLDFGISKVPLQPQTGSAPKGSSAGLGNVRLTSVFGAVGTPAYMSPEQIKDPCAVDARTDVWALGVMLYETMSGELPFLSDNLGALFAEICTRDPPHLDRVVPDVPPDLARVVRRCLQADAKQRFDNASQLAAALGQIRRRMSEPAPAVSLSGSPPSGPVASVPAPARGTVSVAPATPRSPGVAAPSAAPRSPEVAKPSAAPAPRAAKPDGPPHLDPFDWELEAPIPSAPNVPSMAPRSVHTSARPSPAAVAAVAKSGAGALDLDDGIGRIADFALDDNSVIKLPERVASAPVVGLTAASLRPPSSQRSLPPDRSEPPSSARAAAGSTGRRIMMSGVVPKIPATTGLEIVRLALVCMLGAGIGLGAQYLSPRGLILAERTWAAQAPLPYAGAAVVLLLAGLWVFVRAGRSPSALLLFAGLSLWVLAAASGVAAAVLGAPGLVPETWRTIGLLAAPWAAVASLAMVGGHGALRVRERRAAGAGRGPMTLTLLFLTICAAGLAGWVVLGPRASTDEVTRLALSPAEVRAAAGLRRFAVAALGARVLLREPPAAAPDGSPPPR
jgi:serine/threonine protein kinase